MLDDAALASAPVRAQAVQTTWSELLTSGPTLFSAERQAIIADARAAWRGATKPNPASGALGEVAHWLAVDAGGITAGLVDAFEAEGLDRHRYLEAVGVVGRLANVDFYLRGLGAADPDLPGPDDSVPTGEVDRRARLTDGWVPALGSLSAPHVLDALPGEGRSLRALHEPMYVAMTQIGNGRYVDELSKPQIEFLAARASYLNECFY